MTFKIDTGGSGWDGPNFSFGKIEDDENLQIDLSNYTRAERFKRQTLATVWGVDTEEGLTEYMDGKSAMLDALFLAYPDMWDEIQEQEQECRDGLKAGAANASASADTDPAEPGNSLGIKF